MKTFFVTFWAYLSVIISDTYTIKMKTLLERNLMGIWLMSCTVLLAAFAGLLRNLMIKPKPIYWIDSWNDLGQWQHLNIVTSSFGEIYYYVNHYVTDSLAKNFAKRIMVTDHDKLAGDESNWDRADFGVIKDHKVALVGDLYYLDIAKQNLISRYAMIEDLDFHISKSEDRISQPTFTLTNRLTFNDSMASTLNLM